MNQSEELGDIGKNVDFNTCREIALIGIRLLDDAYMAWVAAEFDSEQALQAWSDGVSGEQQTAYQSYRAAADREEAAARDLQRLHELTEVCLEALVLPEEHVPGRVREEPAQYESDDARDRGPGADSALPG